MKLLAIVKQGKRNITKRHDRTYIISLTVHDYYQRKLSFLYFWRMNTQAIAVTLALVRRLNDRLSVVA